MPTMLTTIYFIGALRVILCDATGRVVAVESRVGASLPSCMFSPEYIARAERDAQIAWAATAEA